MKCKREECPKQARGDEFCSTYCAKRYNEVPEVMERVEDPVERRRRLRRINYLKNKTGRESNFGVENEEAMLRRVPGSFGTGKRQ